MRKKYPSDITRAQFEHIRGILERRKEKDGTAESRFI